MCLSIFQWFQSLWFQKSSQEIDRLQPDPLLCWSLVVSLPNVFLWNKGQIWNWKFGCSVDLYLFCSFHKSGWLWTYKEQIKVVHFWNQPFICMCTMDSCTHEFQKPYTFRRHLDWRYLHFPICFFDNFNTLLNNMSNLWTFICWSGSIQLFSVCMHKWGYESTEKNDWKFKEY